MNFKRIKTILLYVFYFSRAAKKTFHICRADKKRFLLQNSFENSETCFLDKKMIYFEN